MKVIMTCPFCGDEHCIVETENGYHCTSCEYDFTEDDYQHEQLRQKISCLCSANNATEDNPIKCDVIVGEDESQGLSDSEKPHVIGIFHDSEGVVWANIKWYAEPYEVDNLTTSDLKTLVEEIGG